jgi:hypothetical protein
MKNCLTLFIILFFYYGSCSFLKESNESESSYSNELVKGLNEVTKLKQTILDLVNFIIKFKVC